MFPRPASTHPGSHMSYKRGPEGGGEVGWGEGESNSYRRISEFLRPAKETVQSLAWDLSSHRSAAIKMTRGTQSHSNSLWHISDYLKHAPARTTFLHNMRAHIQTEEVLWAWNGRKENLRFPPNLQKLSLSLSLYISKRCILLQVILLGYHKHRWLGRHTVFNHYNRILHHRCYNVSPKHSLKGEFKPKNERSRDWSALFRRDETYGDVRDQWRHCPTV